jgi:hypothetical protein
MATASKLSEAKELLDAGLIEQGDYDSIKQNLMAALMDGVGSPTPLRGRSSTMAAGAAAPTPADAKRARSSTMEAASSNASSFDIPRRCVHASEKGQCSRTATSTSIRCERHTCTQDGCIGDKDSGDDFCNEHGTSATVTAAAVGGANVDINDINDSGSDDGDTNDYGNAPAIVAQAAAAAAAAAAEGSGSKVDSNGDHSDVNNSGSDDGDTNHYGNAPAIVAQAAAAAAAAAATEGQPQESTSQTPSAEATSKPSKAGAVEPLLCGTPASNGESVCQKVVLAHGQRCKNHTCGTKGCTNPKGSKAKHCSQHDEDNSAPARERTTTGSSKPLGAVETFDGFEDEPKAPLLCGTPASNGESVCQKVVLARDQRCKNHTCGTKGCSNPKGSKAKHCSQHDKGNTAPARVRTTTGSSKRSSATETFDGFEAEPTAPLLCGTPASSGESVCQTVVLARGQRCKRHTCGTKGCTNPKGSASKHCSQHDDANTAPTRVRSTTGPSKPSSANETLDILSGAPRKKSSAKKSAKKATRLATVVNPTFNTGAIEPGGQLLQSTGGGGGANSETVYSIYTGSTPGPAMPNTEVYGGAEYADGTTGAQPGGGRSGGFERSGQSKGATAKAKLSNMGKGFMSGIGAVGGKLKEKKDAAQLALNAKVQARKDKKDGANVINQQPTALRGPTPPDVPTAQALEVIENGNAQARRLKLPPGFKGIPPPIFIDNPVTEQPKSLINGIGTVMVTQHTRKEAVQGTCCAKTTSLVPDQYAVAKGPAEQATVFLSGTYNPKQDCSICCKRKLFLV